MVTLSKKTMSKKKVIENPQKLIDYSTDVKTTGEEGMHPVQCAEMPQECCYDERDGISSDERIKIRASIDAELKIEEDGSNCFNKWSKVGDAIIAANDTFEKLEPGYYNVDYSQNLGLFFTKLNISSNEIYRLPNKACDTIMDDISKFWTLEEQYKKYKRVFRRNYLLYSAPGTGKTSLIRLMCKELIEKYQGIVFSLSDIRRELELVVDGITRVRNIEPDKKIIVVMEDIDTCITSSEQITRSSNETETLLLNMLDGFYQFNNVVVIATTNYIENIPPRFKNRPSRFNRVIEFPLPNSECRRTFLQKSIFPDDLAKIDLDEWVRKTDGYTIDHLNEVIMTHFVHGETEDYAFEEVDKMVKENSKLRNKTSITKKQSMGFVDEDGEDGLYEMDTPVNSRNSRVTSTYKRK